MDDPQSLNNVSNLLFQLALQTRELSQTKDDISQQIEVCRSDISKTKSYIETNQGNIKKCEEEMVQRQNMLNHVKVNAKSMKATNTLLQQYEKSLKEELERMRESYDQDTKVYAEKITSYKNVFQQHKEHYCQNPLAKKLFTIQDEKEEIECRIKACDNEIKVKQKAMGYITSSVPMENLPESISEQLMVTDTERSADNQTGEDINSTINVSRLHLAQAKDVDKISSEEAGAELHGNIMAEDPPAYEEAHEVCVQPEPADQMPGVDPDQGSGRDEQEEYPIMQEIDETVGKQMNETQAADEEILLVADKETEGERMASPARPQPQSSPARMKVMSSTPTFSLNSSPGGSPGPGTSDGKSPSFLFSMNPDPSTPGFSGFGFNMSSSQEEDPPFTFTSCYFSDKKSSEPKSPNSQGFLFDQTERSDDFQFSFGSKSPEATIISQDKSSGDTFPFSFNFGKF